METLAPDLVVRAKSVLDVSRFNDASTSYADAEMRTRPLARRAARTARPPRVAIRARKPCFLRADDCSAEKCALSFFAPLII